MLQDNDKIWRVYLDGQINCYDCVRLGMSQTEFERRHGKSVDWDWTEHAARLDNCEGMTVQ